MSDIEQIIADMRADADLMDDAAQFVAERFLRRYADRIESATTQHGHRMNTTS